MVDFTPEPRCPNCDAELGWPVGHTNENEIEFRCTTCGPVDGYHTVSIEDIPPEYLQKYHTFVSRINAAIELDGGEPRFPSLFVALRSELTEREDVNLNEFGDLTHRVHLSKKQVMELDDEYPGISTVGEPPEDAEYEFGMSPSDIEFYTLMNESEADEITSEYDGITAEPL